MLIANVRHSPVNILYSPATLCLRGIAKSSVSFCSVSSIKTRCSVIRSAMGHDYKYIKTIKKNKDDHKRNYYCQETGSPVGPPPYKSVILSLICNCFMIFVIGAGLVQFITGSRYLGSFVFFTGARMWCDFHGIPVPFLQRLWGL